MLDNTARGSKIIQKLQQKPGSAEISAVWVRGWLQHFNLIINYKILKSKWLAKPVGNEPACLCVCMSTLLEMEEQRLHVRLLRITPFFNSRNPSPFCYINTGGAYSDSKTTFKNKILEV